MFSKPTVIPFATTSLLLFILPLLTKAIYYEPLTDRTTYPTVKLEFPSEAEGNSPELAPMKMPLIHKDEYGINLSEQNTDLIFADLIKQYKTSVGKPRVPPAIVMLSGETFLHEHGDSPKERLVRIVDRPETAFRTYCTYIDEGSKEFGSGKRDVDFSQRHFTKEMMLPADAISPELHCAAFYINPEFGDEMKAFIGFLDEE